MHTTKSWCMTVASLAVGAALLAGCANLPPSLGGDGYNAASQPGAEEVRQGVVTRIDPVEIKGHDDLGLGAILGAAAGGLVGSQIGSGGGSTVATVLGVLGGGFAGSKLQNNVIDRKDGENIFVRLNNGVTIAVTQPMNVDLRIGDRVYVEGQGQDARVNRR
jgi:outer membrane lipoprotein SlyB